MLLCIVLSICSQDGSFRPTLDRQTGQQDKREEKERERTDSLLANLDVIQATLPVSQRDCAAFGWGDIVRGLRKVELSELEGKRESEAGKASRG